MGRLSVSHCVCVGVGVRAELHYKKNLNVKGWLSSVLSLQLICRSNTHAEFLFVRDQAIELIFHSAFKDI